jgi:hypothetical protein
MTIISGKAAEQLIYYTTLTLISEGVINAAGKTDKELHDEISGILTTRPVQLIADHTDTFLKDARLSKASGQFKRASLFYALWFEHRLNGIIDSLARRHGLNETEIESVIRHNRCKDKCARVLSNLGIRLNAAHVEVILQLMRLRNEFVHYKWKSSNSNTQEDAVMARIEKTVNYIRRVEDKYLYYVQKKRTRKFLKRSFSA